MFPSIQPSRPRISPAHPSLPPMNQQPSRTLSFIPPSPPSPPRSVTAGISGPGPTYEPPRATRPRNQLEAMPPFAPAPPVFDVSRRHPVFFTDRLKKAPAGVATGGGVWTSPVSQGYVFNDGVKRKVEGEVKL